MNIQDQKRLFCRRMEKCDLMICTGFSAMCKNCFGSSCSRALLISAGEMRAALPSRSYNSVQNQSALKSWKGTWRKINTIESPRSLYSNPDSTVLLCGKWSFYADMPVSSYMPTVCARRLRNMSGDGGSAGLVHCCRGRRRRRHNPDRGGITALGSPDIGSLCASMREPRPRPRPGLSGFLGSWKLGSLESRAGQGRSIVLLHCVAPMIFQRDQDTMVRDCGFWLTFHTVLYHLTSDSPHLCQSWAVCKCSRPLCSNFRLHFVQFCGFRPSFHAVLYHLTSDSLHLCQSWTVCMWNRPPWGDFRLHFVQ